MNKVAVENANIEYDIIIIGAGPGGLFSAFELVHRNNDLKILIIDKGKDVDERSCPPNTTGCISCGKTCDVLHGVGGVGLYIDAKLCLAYVGSILDMPEKTMMEMIDYVDNIIYRFLTEIDEDIQRKGKKITSTKYGLMKCFYYPVRPLGSDVARQVAKSFKNLLINKNVEIKLQHRALHFNRHKKLFKINVLNENKEEEIFKSKYLIVCPGRSGASWLVDEGNDHNFEFINNKLDLGIRVEFNSRVGDEIFKVSPNPKFKLFVNDTQIKTHCFCHKGYVFYYRDDRLFVDGHSDKNYTGKNSNINILYKIEFPKDVDILEYKNRLISNINSCGKGLPIIQRLGDFKRFIISDLNSIKNNSITPSLEYYTPYDIGLLYPRTVCNGILSFINEFDRQFPGFGDDDTLLYIPTAEWGGRTIITNEFLETNVPNLYVGGDGAGLSQGVIAAGITGVIIARDIIKKEKRK